MLRSEGGDSGEGKLLAGHGDGIADGEDAGVKDTDHVAGVGLLHNLPFGSHHLLGLGKPHFPAPLDMVVFRIPGEFAGADAHKGQPVPVGLIHVGLDLEHKGGEIRAEGIDGAAVGHTAQRGRRQLQEGFQEGLNAEVCQCGAEEHRAQLSPADLLQVHFPTGGQKLNIVNELLVLLLTVEKPGHLGIIQVNGLLACLVLAGNAGEEQELAVFPVVNPLEIFAGADGPVHGVGLNAQLPLQFVQQVEGILRLPVHFVDKGENGNMPHGTDLEQLPGLGFHALGAVNDHDGGIRGHQGAVGILREILVARGIQNVDAEALILELHHG